MLCLSNITFHYFVFQLPVPVGAFLHPPEKDTDLLTLYFRALIGHIVNPDSSPFMYLIALHHVTNFLFSSRVSAHERRQRFQDGSQVKAKMLGQLSRVRDEVSVVR